MWAIILSQYYYEIEYKSSRNVSYADALSKLPLGDHIEVSGDSVNFCQESADFIQ